MSSLTFSQWLQICAMIGSIIASCYVSLNQHKTLMWKKRKELEEKDGKSKNNEDEG